MRLDTSEVVFSPRPWLEGPGEDGWHRLSTSSRRACLGLLRARACGWREPAALPASGRDELVTEGFLRRARGARAAAHENMPVDSIALVGWLAVTQSSGLLGDSPLLEEHVRRLFPRTEEAVELARRALNTSARPAADEGLVSFLATYPHSPRWPEWLAGTERGPSVEVRLLETIKAWGGKVPVRAVPRLLPGLCRAEVENARLALSRRLVLFHDLNPETLELELGLLATVRLGLEERSRPRLEALREAPARRVAASSSAEGTGPCFGVEASATLLTGRRDRLVLAAAPDDEALRDAVRSAFSALDVERFYDLDAFVTHASFARHAPLLRGAEPERVLATLGPRAIPSFAEAFELASRTLLRDVVLTYLAPRGGASLGRRDGALAFALTARAGELLGFHRRSS